MGARRRCHRWTVHTSPAFARRLDRSLFLALALAAPAGCGTIVVETDGYSGSGGAGGAGTTATTEAPSACAPSGWGRGLADPYVFEYGESVAVDGDCNVLVAGSFGGVIDFGGATITGGDETVFVAKLDPQGQHVWSKSFGIEPFQGAALVGAAPSGDVILAGTFNGSIDFGTGAFNAPKQAIFLAGLAPDGKPRWARTFAGTWELTARGLAVDKSGSAILTGSFDGLYDFGAGSEGLAGATSALVVKVSPLGDTLWMNAYQGGFAKGSSVSVNAAGASVIAGSYRDGIHIGGAFIGGKEQPSMFGVVLDPAGNITYSTNIAGPEASDGAGAILDDGGDAIFAGTFSGATNFGEGHEVTAKGAVDGYLMALDPQGHRRWVTTFDGSGPLSIAQIASDGASGAWITGGFSGALHLGALELQSFGTTDAFVAAVDATGTFVFAKRLGGELGGADSGYAIALDPAGGAVVSGTYQGTADLGSGPVTSAGGFDAFVARVVK